MNNIGVKNECFDDLKRFVLDNEKIKIRTGMTEKTPLVELKTRVIDSHSLEDCIIKLSSYRTIVEQAKGIYIDDDEQGKYEEEIKIGTNDEEQEKVQLTQYSLFTKETVDKYVEKYDEIIISENLEKDEER